MADYTEANRLRDKCRIEAARALSVCASNSLLLIRDVSDAMGQMVTSRWFAHEAWQRAHDRLAPAPPELVYAEAEAMIRCGEVVPTW